jgi:CheY-like chemotaxis protein
MTAGSRFLPVVDDHLANRLAAVPRPRASGGIVCGAGEQAAGSQGALRDEPFDCAPLDLLMPELDGCQVLEHVSSDPSRSGTRRRS